MSQRRVHYVLSTHWDREWYQSFQDFRYQLVRLLDRVLDGLMDNRLRGPFQTDGQSIILEDYLEIRPDRRPQIEELAQAGKLVIGPWYVLPDEFLVSGESLIRNIRLGRQIARSFGTEPSDAGFVCDLFGHNSQMPQIFAGFGIRGGFVWRGTNANQTRNLRWRGADGTELITYRFPHIGYCDYSFKVRHARQPDHAFDPVPVEADFADYLQVEREHTAVDPILLFDGGDHQEWDQKAYTVVTDFMDEGFEDLAIVHTSLDTYLDEMLDQADRIQTVLEGELREPGRDWDEQQWVIPGVLSSRVWIKQANAECQTLLCHWAEPATTLAHLVLGEEVPQGFLALAWKWLLKNHPHDSICGCSIDQVHEDMVFRFSQSRQISQRLTQEATQTLAASVAGDVGDDELRVTLFNPLPQALDETTEVLLQIPAHWPTFNEFFGYEPKPAFRIYGPDGEEIPYQRLSQTNNRTKRRDYEANFPETYRTHDVGVSLPLQVPALGYTTLTVRAEQSGKATRYPTLPGLATSERSMANQYLDVTIEPNGTLTLIDKRSGQVYRRLLTFEDAADIGDGWYHGQAVNDAVYVSSASSAAVALIHDGPYLTTFRVRTSLLVPADFAFDDRMRRSDELVELAIDTDLSLRPGSDRLEAETTVHNVAKDHRLRVLFPSSAQTDTYWADTPFDVVERPIALRRDNHRYRELEVETRPQQSWTAVCDDERGLAVVSSGLLETAIQDRAERSLALTLFRATRRTVMTDGEPGGQLQEPMTFRYWILPLTGPPDSARLTRLGQQIAAGTQAVQLRPKDIALHRTDRELPAATSFLRLEGDAVLTSLRHVDGGVEVRLFNPTAAAIQPTLHLDESLALGRVQPVDFESRPAGETQTLQEGTFTVSLQPKQITTLRFS